jgi:hypothetical protein
LFADTVLCVILCNLDRVASKKIETNAF